MTLELSKVAEQADRVGEQMAERMQRRQAALPALRALRTLYAHEGERLRALAESPQGQEAKCALPTTEPLDAAIAAPPPEQATILAADGSQIYPDPHGWVLYYLINIGSLVYRHGSGETPLAASEPMMAAAVDAEGNLRSGEWVDARRDVAEIQKLADLAERNAGERLVALLDSTIGLRAWSGAIPPNDRAALARRYEEQLARLRRAGAALAGVISRSRQAGVVRLLDLARREQVSGGLAGDPGTSRNLREAEVPSPFQGLTDQMLWGDLRPGERSALFEERKGETSVFFFYLNPMPPDSSSVAGEAEPARIEVPDWVACNSQSLNLVHALVYDQCCLNNGYPYALSRADELAIILNEEREALEAMLWQAMGRRGLPLPRLSPKAAQKRVVRGPFQSVM